MKIVLGITGSVSAYKTPWLVRDLQRAGHAVRVVMTHAATQFVAPLALEATSRHQVVVDPFDPQMQAGGSWHVHLAQWADVMLIAPCSASTLARLAMAEADSAVVLVACSLPKSTPLLVAPAMDTDMWEHPATQRNVSQLKADGAHIIDPDSGELASGLVGAGRLPELSALIDLVGGYEVGSAQHVLHSTLYEVRSTKYEVLVTAGPTHEPIDAVRSIVNHSTGTMGFALAEAAAERGHLVTLVAGPVHLPTPRGVHRIDVKTAAEMFDAVQQHASADIAIMAAAVADFTPSDPADTKLKKSDANADGLILELKRTTDILAWLGANKQPHQLVVGFALETDNVIAYATDKLNRKRADVIVANQAGVADSGFGVGMNTITIVTNETQAPYPPMSKRACAEVILDAALDLLEQKAARNTEEGQQ
jgi:phosphopantothenoylcysteine decarboxylase/phosphopantothenate--cysteine ligase